MDLRKTRRENKDLPTIIADLSGTIIYLSTTVTTALRWLRIGDNVSKVIDLDYVRKITMFQNKIDITLTNITEFDKAVVKINGSGVTRLMEICLYRTETIGKEVLLNEKRLFAIYTDIMSSLNMKSVKLKDFINEVVNSLKEDLRFSYRSFEIEGIDDAEEILINVERLSVLVVGTIVFLNEIEYRNPICISLNKLGDRYIMNLNVKSNTFKKAYGLQEISELYPRLAVRLSYITMICDDCGIEYSLDIVPDEIKTSFEITGAIDTTGTLRYNPFESTVKSFVAYISSLFMYDGFNDTEGGGRE